MDRLTYELKNLCNKNRDGSYATQADRYRQLRLIAAQLKTMGYRKMSKHSLKTKHVTALVKNWTTGENYPDFRVSPGTIKNRLCALRWWADKINKQNVLPRTNKELGIPDRKRIPDTNKAYRLSDHQLSVLPLHLRLSTRLQQEFGLRREEAAKFIPGKAIEDDKIKIKASWAKGGRARNIPITTPEQRALIDDLRGCKQNASMIPPEYNYRKYLQHRDHWYEKTNIRNAHGLRHHYAQQRYIIASGGLLPPRLGGKAPSKLTPVEQALDQKARAIVSNELGHTRTEITRVYLG